MTAAPQYKLTMAKRSCHSGEVICGPKQSQYGHWLADSERHARPRCAEYVPKQPGANARPITSAQVNGLVRCTSRVVYKTAAYRKLRHPARRSVTEFEADTRK
jgi:hypothetical protein